MLYDILKHNLSQTLHVILAECVIGSCPAGLGSACLLRVFLKPVQLKAGRWERNALISNMLINSRSPVMPAINMMGLQGFQPTCKSNAALEEKQSGDLVIPK
jgi:hypothetical protein